MTLEWERGAIAVTSSDLISFAFRPIEFDSRWEIDTSLIAFLGRKKLDST
ncbi:hypothetical protein RRSWK_01148 [Rhodopirellula sp. SWK7]|nr:hypothetical protein RRSWK_01148 [Rhodopirellula sp. SWK7]